MKLKYSSFFRMDERIVYTMVGISLVSIIVLAFRVAGYKSCNNANISFSSDSIFVKDIVRFSSDVKGGKLYSWDFGDGVTQNENIASISHSFKDAKVYTIKMVVNEECTDIKTLVVYEHEINADVPKGPIVVFPENALINESVQFSDNSPASTKWEWYFDGNPEIYSRERNVSYAFKKPGMRKFILKVNDKESFPNSIMINQKPIEKDLSNGNNNASQSGRRRNSPVIVISPIPISDPIGTKKEDKYNNNAEPVKPEAPKLKTGSEISASQFEHLLMQVSEGNKSAADFSGYLCDNLNISVSYQGKVITFSALCEELKNIKAKKIKKIDVFISTKNLNNCITSLSVTIKKKGFLGL